MFEKLTQRQKLKRINKDPNAIVLITKIEYDIHTLLKIICLAQFFPIRATKMGYALRIVQLYNKIITMMGPDVYYATLFLQTRAGPPSAEFCRTIAIFPQVDDLRFINPWEAQDEDGLSQTTLQPNTTNLLCPQHTQYNGKLYRCTSSTKRW